MSLKRVPPGSGARLKSEVLVIGCGQGPAGAGSVEIVGYKTSKGFCYAVDMPRLTRSEGGICIPVNADWRMICGKDHVCANGAIGFAGNGRRFTFTSGQIDPDVEGLVAVEPQGRSMIVRSRLSHKMGEELGINPQIAFIAALVQGCSASGIGLEWVKDGIRDQLTVPRIAPEGCEG